MTIIKYLDQGAEEGDEHWLSVFSYVVFLEKGEVANDSDPHQQSGCSQQDSTNIV